MKLGRYRESNIPVAMSDRPALLCFANLAAAEIPSSKKSVSATGAKSRAWYER